MDKKSMDMNSDISSGMMVTLGEVTFFVERVPISPGEWMYDETPETGLEHIRRCPGPGECYGGGYYKIVSHIPPDEESVFDGVEIIIPL